MYATIKCMNKIVMLRSNRDENLENNRNPSEIEK